MSGEAAVRTALIPGGVIMAYESTNRVALRQTIRKALITFSFILLPVTFVYISCPVITEGASEGIVTGGLIIFGLIFLSSLVFGRAWCGYLCPAGGLQEIYFQLRDPRVRIGRLTWLKYLIFLGIFGPLLHAIYSAGGLSTVDIFYRTVNSISIAWPGGYAIFYAQIAFITVFALLAGKRGFCHYFCPIAVIMILGCMIRNLARWPALHLSADAGRCTDCLQCSKACPMSLDVNGMVPAGRVGDHGLYSLRGLR